MISQPNPMHVANIAQNMAKNAETCDARIFQKVALISMCVMAAASATQVFQSLLRELNRKHDREQSRGR
jgi:hypothetical protein